MIPWNDVPVRVVRPEHLVATCLETGRMKDYERIARFIEQAAFDAAGGPAAWSRCEAGCDTGH